MIISLFTFCVAGACAQKTNAPEPVAKAFADRFPEASSVKWDREHPDEWEAEFKNNGEDVSASFDATGNWLETEHEINPNNLPAVVKDAINAKYGSDEIEEAEMIDSPDFTGAYEVEVESRDQEHNLVIDSTGKILRDEVESDDDED